MRTVCPTRMRSPTASVPASGSAPMIGRTRKSPRSYSGWFSSMTMPSISPCAASRCCSGSSPAIASRSRTIAGCEASSSMMLALAEVTVISGPTGVAPCDTQGTIATPSSEQATAPPCRTSPVAKQRGRARGGGARKAAEDGHPRPALVEDGEQRLGAEGVGIGEHDQRLAQALGRRAARSASGPRRRARPRSDGSRSRRPEPRAPRLPPPGPDSISRPPPRTPPAPQPISDAGREALVDLGEDRLRMTEMGCGRKDDREVALSAEACGRRRRRQRRTPRPDRAHPIRRPRCSPPSLNRTGAASRCGGWASIVARSS